ncbi:DUF916 and DUF3324 domain-containing protein [Carnobacteriaceae bacterium 52-44]
MNDVYYENDKNKGVIEVFSKFFIIFSLFFSFINPLTTTAQENRVPYSVKPILPENQLDPQVTYFDLAMEPKQEQDLEVQVYNSSNEPIKVSVTTHFAATNGNGILTYNGDIKTFDESMKYPFNKQSVVLEKELNIEPKKQKTAIIKVKAPHESFDGQILGGIHFTLKNDAMESEEAIGFQNEYAYVIGVNITELNNDKKVEPELILNGVEVGLINHRTGLQTSFSNKSPVLIEDLCFVGEIFQKGEEEALYDRTVENFSIGPNNKFHFPISFANQPLEEGDYIFKANVKNEEYEWNFEESFSITEEKAHETNDGAIELASTFQWIKVFLVFLILLVLILIVMLFKLWKKKK